LPLGLSLAGFFASTLTKNFLQALGAAVVIIISFVLLAYLAGNLHSFLGIGWNPVLTLGVMTVILLAAVCWLASANFNYFQEQQRVWWRNAFVLTGATFFIFVFSAGLYNRAWEFFAPAEPAHGPAKFSLANPPVLHAENYYDNLLVRLPDGRVWSDYLQFDVSKSDYGRMERLRRYFVDPLPKNAGAQRFVAGSDWRSATTRHVDFLLDYRDDSSQPSNHIVGYLDTVGVKTDGTLWISDASKNGAWTGDKMNRYGSETNWLQIFRAHNGVLLLKNDGTLWSWGWGTNRFEWNTWKTNWPSLHAYQPHQIGADSDWQEITGNPWNYFARKSDGSVWGISVNYKSGEYELGRDVDLDQTALRRLSLPGSGDVAYIRPDGTLWMRWRFEQNRTNTYSTFVQIGSETNWSAAALKSQRLVALKTDGSLWQWRFSRVWNLSEGESVLALEKAAQKPPTRLGIHNDWVAIANTWADVIALAADGSLWLWPDRELYDRETLLKLPKQPKLLGNVFGKPD